MKSATIIATILFMQILGTAIANTDWNIDNPTIADGKTIIVKNLTVNSTLNLKNSNLTVNEITVNGLLNIENSTLKLNGNLSIEKNATIVFEEVNFIMDSTKEYEFLVKINGNAIFKNSTFSSKNEFLIIANENSTFELRNSELKNTSLIIYANNTKIEDNEIYFAENGIKIFSSFNEIKGNTIAWNYNAILLENSSNNNFISNYIHSGRNRILINYSSNNTFEEISTVSSEGFLIYNSNNIVFINSSIINTYYNFKTYNSSLIFKGTNFNETRTIFENTTIEFGSYLNFKVVDTENQKIDNAEIKVLNNSIQIFSGYTDEYGEIKRIYLIYYIKNLTTTYFTYTVKVKKENSINTISNLNVSSNRNIEIELDVILPSVNILFPSPNSYFNYTTVFINGTTLDNTNISMVEVSLNNKDWNSAILNFTENTIYWNATLNLNIGTNTIYVRAIDIQGNNYTTYILAIVDLTNPKISNINVLNITDVSAKITSQTDEDCNLTVEYGTSKNNYTFIDKNNEFKIQQEITISGNVGLLPNTTYYFRVKVYDKAGNFNYSNEYSFTTEDIPDIAPPYLLNLTPKDEEIVIGKEVNISAEYIDYSGIDYTSIKLFIDNIEVANSSSKNAIITDRKIVYIAKNLTEGIHIIRLEVSDRSANKNKANVSWKFYLEYPDNITPYLFIMSHKNNTEVKTNEIKLSGNASDNKEIKAILVSINNGNWSNANLTGNATHKNWEINVQLNEGKNIIKVKAIDGSGNEKEITIEINLKKEVLQNDYTAYYIALIITIALIVLVYIFLRKR